MASLKQDMLENKDQEQLDKLGITTDKFEIQVSQFEKGIPSIKLIKPATLDDGISLFDEVKEDELIQLFNRFKDSLDIVKFVPASGAATRMFKSLFEGLNEINENIELNGDALKFLQKIDDYPFYDEHLEALSENNSTKDYKRILEYILFEIGLNYSNKPKALVCFHKEHSESRTAFEEHFLESILYSNSEGKGRLHFTVSEEHLEELKSLSKALKAKYKEEISLSVEFSLQKESTNTIAVYENGGLVRLENNALMLRPAGHGALLSNLNDINAQLIFIKNIDNVCTSKWHEENAKYKALLAGRLLEMRENIHNLLNGLIHEGGIRKASDVIFNRWGIRTSNVEEIKHILDRPLRVCGMVKNTGAPGGGPFWVEEKDSSSGKQIVESSQVNLNDSEQRQIWESSTHFNPVDLVCWVENHSGEKFDLLQYRDDDTGFISTKSYEGKIIKVLELPGLWNGAMSGWITEFVEVPLHTFNPVKTVLDLMNEGHRN